MFYFRNIKNKQKNNKEAKNPQKILLIKFKVGNSVLPIQLSISHVLWKGYTVCNMQVYVYKKRKFVAHTLDKQITYSSKQVSVNFMVSDCYSVHAYKQIKIKQW